MKTQVEIGWNLLEAEEMRRKVVKEDVAWRFQKSVVHVVDKIG